MSNIRHALHESNEPLELLDLLEERDVDLGLVVVAVLLGDLPVAEQEVVEQHAVLGVQGLRGEEDTKSDPGQLNKNMLNSVKFKK